MASKAKPDSSTAEREATGLRQVMSIVHTWSTLVPIWVLYFVFITGTIGYFHVEVTNWMKPEIGHVAEPVDESAMLYRAEQFLRENADGASTWTIVFPSERKETAQLFWAKSLSPEERAELSPDEQEELREANSGRVDLHPATGVTYDEEVRETGGGNLLYRMHYVLHYMPRAVGEYIVIICTILMFAGLVTGIVIHKKIFKDFFTFRPSKGQRSWLDTHNIFSVMTLPFQLMITFSGMVFYLATIMPLVFYGPAVTLGFDLENALSAQSIEDLSPKNRELFEIINEEVLGNTPAADASGVSASMVPLPQVLADYRSLHPEHPISTIRLQNAFDQNASVVVQAQTGVDREPLSRETYSAVTGELLSQSTQASQGSVSAGVQQVVLSLHEGRFSPIALRWLYFLSGLAGAAMVASGAVLWVRKRRQAHEAELKRFAKKNAGPEAASATPKIGRGVVFVEHMNVATIIGLPIGVAAYFIANRLIPTGLEERGALEADAMFIAWALTLVVAIIRPRTRIWTELMWVACVAYAAIPFVNAFTTDRHLGISLPAGDWMMAGFDLTMFGIAALFGLAARRSAVRKTAPKTKTQPVIREPMLDPAE